MGDTPGQSPDGIDPFHLAHPFVMNFLLVNVQMRAAGTNRAAVGIPFDYTTFPEEPHPLAVLVSQAMLCLVKRRFTSQMAVPFFQNMRPVVGMDHRFPDLQIRGQFIRGISQHLGPACVQYHFSGFHVPVPGPQLGTFQGQLHAFFIFHHPFTQGIFFGNVPEDQNRTDDVAVRVSNGGAGIRDLVFRPVF